MTVLKWKRPEEAGYPDWQTHDGRYQLEPLFNHGTRPWAYRVYFAPIADAPRQQLKVLGHTVREAKEAAQRHADKLTQTARR